MWGERDFKTEHYATNADNFPRLIPLMLWEYLHLTCMTLPLSQRNRACCFPCDLLKLLQAEFEFSKRSLETVEASHKVCSLDLQKRQQG